MLQVFIKLKDKDAGLSTEVKVAKMSLIDLAGSEKVRHAFELLNRNTNELSRAL